MKINVLIVGCIVCLNSYGWWPIFTGGPTDDFGKTAIMQSEVKQAQETVSRYETNLFELLEQVELKKEAFALDLEIGDTFNSDLDRRYIKAENSEVLKHLEERKESYLEENLDKRKDNAVEVATLTSEFGAGGNVGTLKRTEMLRGIGGTNVEVYGEDITGDMLRKEQMDGDYIEYAKLIAENERRKEQNNLSRELRNKVLDQQEFGSSIGLHDADSANMLNSWNSIKNQYVIKNQIETENYDTSLALEYNKINMFQRRNEFIADKVINKNREAVVESILK